MNDRTGDHEHAADDVWTDDPLRDGSGPAAAERSGATGSPGTADSGALAPTSAEASASQGDGVIQQEPEPARPVDVRGGGMGSAWFVLVIGALLLIGLLVFVLQNLSEVDIAFLGWEFAMPVGVVILFAAIVGALVMALLAAMRILQLRHRAHKASRAGRTTRLRGRGRR